MQIGDSAAAVGFYQRAAKLAPTNPNVKAGLAGAYALNDDPIAAINLFNEAEQAGPIDPALLGPRGLAYDLVGDNQTAQKYYKLALAAGSDDETVRRLALSQAIGGDRRAMELTLTPLLQKQDKGAWRTRAFALAILGQGAEAESIVRSTMPAQLAEPMTAYLRYMPRLTAAQQAAAGNLGRFPRASEIGMDDPRMAAYSRSRVQVAAATPSPAAQPGKGKSSGRGMRGAQEAKVQPVRPVAAVPPPEPQVSRETTTASRPAVSASSPVETPRLAPVQAAAPPPPEVNSASSFAAAPVATEAAPQPTAPRKPATLDEAFADLAPPSAVIEPKAGAVDVRSVRPVVLARKEPVVKEPAAKEAAAKPVPGKTATGKDQTAKDKVAAEKDGKAQTGKTQTGKEKAGKDNTGKDAKGKDAKGKPSHPSRIWVQIAAGRNKPALAFDWRKFAKEDPAVFKAQKPYVTQWGQTNRLLIGPFASAKEAEAYLAKVKKTGRDGAFIWTSPAGQVVDGLSADK